jgi:hypothetical protein
MKEPKIGDIIPAHRIADVRPSDNLGEDAAWLVCDFGTYKGVALPDGRIRIIEKADFTPPASDPPPR